MQILLLALVSTPFHAAHHGLNDLEFQQVVSTAFTQLCPELSYVAPRLLAKVAADKKNTSDKIRIGFVSSHLHQHSIGKILHETICNMLSDDLEVTVFLLSKGGQSVQDEITALFEACLGRQEAFVRLPWDISQVREVIGSEKYALDALIFTDVGMDIASVTLVQSRLAPLQVGRESLLLVCAAHEVSINRSHGGDTPSRPVPLPLTFTSD
jgi:predicted O-linked N-acetylglucosamine transferase (SPINDLY family)